MEGRDEGWIAAMATRLESVIGAAQLGDDGYTGEACARLATAMHDLDLGRHVQGLAPGQRLLLTLLREQPDIGEAEAVVLAGALPRLRLGRVLLSAMDACDLLDVDRSTLLRRRYKGDIRAMLAARGERAVSVWYALWQLLHVMAFQRQHPYIGGAVQGWPERLD